MFAAVLLLLGLFAERLAMHIPFGFEQAMVARFSDALPPANPTTARLQGLADRLAVAIELPPDMSISIHYTDDDVVNAFATLGGHVMLHGGLVRKLPSENALAMLLAHEMAHIKLRHPLRSLGRVAVIWVALTALTGADGSSIGANVLGSVTTLTLLSFSRSQEIEADREAIAGVNRLYGHTADALGLVPCVA